MKSRRSKSSDRKNKKANYADEESGFRLINVSSIGERQGQIEQNEEESLEEIIQTSVGARDRTLTKSTFFYDLRVMRHPKKKNGLTKSGFWIHLLIWFGIILYSALMIMEGLEIVNVGWDNPLFYLIFHACLTTYFGFLLVYSAASFMEEPLLSDNLRPAVVTGHAFFTNGVSAILFLIWVVTNTNFIFNTNYDKDPEGTMDYKDVIIVCFVLYVIWITVILITYMIRFAFAKFVEILSMVVRHLDKNPASDYLETLLYKADRYLNSGSDFSFDEGKDIETTRGRDNFIRKRSNRMRSRKKRSRSKNRTKWNSS